MIPVEPAFLNDPTGPSALVTAADWIQGTLLGTIATVIAVICVAWVGLLMFSGRIDVRRGLTAVLGCFVLFSAAGIVDGLRSAMGARQPLYRIEAPPPAPSPVLPANAAMPYDPYAGASVIRR